MPRDWVGVELSSSEALIYVLFQIFTCSSWTNKLITAKDHRSVQINIGHLDENGVYTNSFSTFALCGQVRARVRS